MRRGAPDALVVARDTAERWVRVRAAGVSARFADWREAHAAAVDKANRCGLDVAIRRVREYGQDGFNISLACRNDSDYARAEIVGPGDPRSA